MGKLTVVKVRALTAPGRYGDGGTLHLVVSPRRTKSWVQRITIDGRRRDIGLGGWPIVSLAMARDRAFTNRRAVADGRDPLAHKRRRTIPTFREASERALEANRPRWRNVKTSDNWIATMAKYVHPVFGDRRVDQIRREDVLRVLTPVWTAKPEIGRKVRQRIRATLAWAQAHGHVEHNLAGDAIDGALPSLPSVKAHFRALPYREVSAALEIIEASRASVSAKACLRFVVLTACRSGEARLATWDEIDLEAREWRIPESRMKTGIEHRVPLADAALGRAGTRPVSAQCGRPVVPVAVEAGEDAERHDVDEDPAGHRTGRPRHGARLPFGVPNVGERADERAARRLRNGARASGRVRRGAELRAVGPVREAPRADGPVGRVRHWRERQGAALARRLETRLAVVQLVAASVDQR